MERAVVEMVLQTRQFDFTTSHPKLLKNRCYSESISSISGDSEERRQMIAKPVQHPFGIAEMTEPPKPEFDIFLSHNKRDELLVEQIARKLQAVGLNPWLDKWILVPGTRWQEGLVEGLRKCATCGVFIGPNGFGNWNREELEVAQIRAAKEPCFRLIPILLPGLPEPFDFDALPAFLATRMWVDLRKGIDTPRALDILVKAIKGIPAGSGDQEVITQNICPYRGLQRFEESDAYFFLGRDRDRQRIIEKLKATRFLAVLGPSGSGKSSLVRAGIIPDLRKGALPGSSRWKICILQPSADPICALAANITALNQAGTMKRLCNDMLGDFKTLHREATLALTVNSRINRILLVIDQFEEVFTLCTSKRERRQFIANLLYATSIPGGPCMTLLTMRADFYGKCADFSELAARIGAQQFLVGPMDADMLRQAIEEPARRVGLRFEAGLIDAILQDVEDQPGSLPLLEHALFELWENRSGDLLTFHAYVKKIGRVAGALARRAQAIYEGFDQNEQQVAQRILLRLIQPGEGTEDTKRRVRMSELITRPGEELLIEKVIEAFANARLLTTS